MTESGERILGVKTIEFATSNHLPDGKVRGIFVLEMMNSAFKKMNFVFKMMNSVFKMMTYVFKMMNSVFKRMTDVFKMMNSVF